MKTITITDKQADLTVTQAQLLSLLKSLVRDCAPALGESGQIELSEKVLMNVLDLRSPLPLRSRLRHLEEKGCITGYMEPKTKAA